MFRLSQGQVDHHNTSGTDSSLDAVFGNCIMMVATDVIVFDTLTLGEKFIEKLFGSVDLIVSTLLLYGNTNSCNLTLEL